MQYIIAVAAVLMTVALLFGIRHRTDHSILYASVAASVSFVTNLNEIFIPVDTWIAGVTGKSNLLGLFGTMMMVVSAYFFARAVLRAKWTEPDRLYEVGFRLSLLFVLVGMVASFWLVETDHSSTAFMREFGSQPAAAVYSVLQFGYIGLVMFILGLTAGRATRTQKAFSSKLGAGLVTAACVAAVLMVVSVFGMDAANLLGNMPLLSLFAGIYTPSTALTMIFLWVGLSTFPIARSLKQRSTSAEKTALFNSVRIAHGKLVRGPQSYAEDQVMQPDLDSRIYRLLIEIQDELLKSPDRIGALSSEDRSAVRLAEQQRQGA